jgi:hypothetical protein
MEKPYQPRGDALNWGSCEPAAGEAQACHPGGGLYPQSQAEGTLFSLTKETVERNHASELDKRFET